MQWLSNSTTETVNIGRTRYVFYNFSSRNHKMIPANCGMLHFVTVFIEDNYLDSYSCQTDSDTLNLKDV